MGISGSSQSESERRNERCITCGGRRSIHATCPRCGNSWASNSANDPTLNLLTCVQVLPFEETLPEDLRDSLSLEQRLLEEYLHPYFREQKGAILKPGKRFQYKEVDFKVMACKPPVGRINPDTQVRALGPLLRLENLTKVHILPTQGSLEGVPPRERFSDEKDMFENYIKPFLQANPEDLHLAAGDLFMMKGIQFMVVAAVPNNGLVDRRTVVYSHGPPVPDIEKCSLLPIMESLPNSEKKIQPAEALAKYLKPYLSCCNRMLKQGEDVIIDGVTFRVVAAVPDHGLVTGATHLYNDGSPLLADDLKREQEREDAAMARRLQQQESTENSPLEYRARFHELIQHLPPNDPNRILFERMTIALMPGHEGGYRGEANLIQVLRNLQEGGGGFPGNIGVSAQEIEALPTRKYVDRNKPSATGDGKQSESDENKTCRICLCEYETDEVLRTLPCFHSYHSQCIDKWLLSNPKCPICKTSVRQHQP
eukprot:gb/GEZN01004102.1/.p1 GENE.gb/GEZN01004102.1/~~gb/GEZN01004102.1/.p1  ORF type:complete len:482 (-),score=31.87 gb/GEZN01004102.1/:237-1682(-)